MAVRYQSPCLVYDPEEPILYVQLTCLYFNNVNHPGQSSH